MGSPAQPVTGVPVALTIAGSDSGGGAGIQADLKVFFALGCHGTSALTALTAQNTRGVEAIQEVPPDFVESQITAVTSDLDVKAVKTGMLATASIVETIARSVERLGLPLVVDPVFVSKHGASLLQEEAIGALKTSLLPHATVVTPNLYEAEGLVGHAVRDLDSMEAAARILHGLGAANVLIKGGHLETDEATDLFSDGRAVRLLEGPRYETEDTHGTGCALAAAITAHLARGEEVARAVDLAKDFVAGAIRHGLRLGAGHGPVNPGWASPGAAGYAEG